MTKQLIISTLLLLSWFSLRADLQEAASRFEQGNAAYAEGNFEEAIAHYEAAAEEGTSLALHFNLGNAYFKTNQVAMAILNYERAFRIDPADTDVKYNLKLANERIKDRIEELPQLNITRWWKSFTIGTGIDTWAWLAVGCMMLALASWLLFFLANQRGLRIAGFYIALFMLLLAGISYYQAGHAKRLVAEQTEAVVITPRVDVKGSPTETGINVFVIHEGTKLRVLQEQDGWVNVRIASGNEGWMRKSDVIVI